MVLLLDCTLRDGGYTNNWEFTKEQVVDNYVACKNSRIDFCEVGFRRTKPDPEFGVWYNSTESIINETLGAFVTDACKLAIMAQMGTFTIDDFVPKKDSNVTMVRVLIAYHCKNKNDAELDVELLHETCSMVRSIKNLGYTTTVNIGRIDKLTNDQLIECCNILSGCETDYLYFADTYGNLGMVKMNAILTTIKNNYPGKVGFHAHDNLLNASVKTIDAMYNGCDIVDATIGGLGRGSGNAKTELVIAHLLMAGDSTYDILPVLEYGEKWVSTYKQNHVLYFITGMYSMHVNYAITLIEKYTLSLKQCYDILLEIVKMDKHHFFDATFLHNLCGLQEADPGKK
jgi:4-hydroxy 2-oxovalerate aldolase